MEAKNMLTRPKQFKHIQHLAPKEREEFLNSFDLVFCDCDGVIWQALRDPIQGSAAAIDFLRQRGKRIKFVTNNSIHSVEDVLKKFERCGIAASKCDLIHPAQTVCDYLKSIRFEGLILCLASAPFKQILKNAGYQLVEERELKYLETVADLWNAIHDKDPVKAVIIDVDFNMTVAKLMRAHLHLKKSDCLFIGGAADVVVPFAGGDIIGSGPFITVVELSTKRKATILGKPGHALGEWLKQEHSTQDPRRVLFVGDSLTSDIEFANKCGYQTLLVLTGGTKTHDLQPTLSECATPDYVANSLGDLNELS